jgi:hypothetical protein
MQAVVAVLVVCAAALQLQAVVDHCHQLCQ